MAIVRTGLVVDVQERIFIMGKIGILAISDSNGDNVYYGRLLSVSEFAKKHEKTRQWVHWLIKNNKIKEFVKIGHVYAIPENTEI